MCICIDANQFGDFLNPQKHQNMAPIHQWLEESNGKIVYTDVQKFAKDFSAFGGTYWKVLAGYRTAGKARFIPKEHLPTVDENSIRSNDPHILALCLASKTKLLVTKDKKLIKDFPCLIEGGKIYDADISGELLTPDICLTDESD